MFVLQKEDLLWCVIAEEHTPKKKNEISNDKKDK